MTILNYQDEKEIKEFCLFVHVKTIFTKAKDSGNSNNLSFFEKHLKQEEIDFILNYDFSYISLSEVGKFGKIEMTNYCNTIKDLYKDKINNLFLRE